MGTNVKSLGPAGAWDATLSELELQMTRATFNTWLKDARLGGVDIDGGQQRFTILVRNDYAKDWLENRLDDTIKRTLAAIMGEDVRLRYVIKAEFEMPLEPEAPPANGVNGSGGNVPDEVRQQVFESTSGGYGKQTKRRGGGDEDDNTTPVRYRRIRPPTDPLGGFVRTSHYAIRFWRPYLGADLFDLLQIISSYAYEFEVLGKDGPTIKTLARKLGRGDVSKLVGRAATKRKGGGMYAGQTGLLNELRDHNLCHHHSEGKGRGQKQYFDFLTKVEDLPLLTPKQVAKLSQEDQEEHRDWLRIHTGADYELWEKDERETAVLAIPLEEYA